MMTEKKYERVLKRRASRPKKDYGCCAYCGEDAPEIMKRAQSHHEEGRATSDHDENSCPNCHTFIHEKAGHTSPDLRSSDMPPHKRAKALRYQGAALERIGQNLAGYAEELEEVDSEKGETE